jgi:hypothetical protein
MQARTLVGLLSKRPLVVIQAIFCSMQTARQAAVVNPYAASRNDGERIQVHMVIANVG